MPKKYLPRYLDAKPSTKTSVFDDFGRHNGINGDLCVQSHQQRGFWSDQRKKWFFNPQTPTKRVSCSICSCICIVTHFIGELKCDLNPRSIAKSNSKHTCKHHQYLRKISRYDTRSIAPGLAQHFTLNWPTARSRR